MTAYYNEIDPYAAQWLRNLIKAGHIAPGDVDERSIVDVRPEELAGYTQCHFFAGLGGWSLALRLAGWDDDRPVWTGSCPCQPFSAAGKGKAADDERHLWPAWLPLIAERRPPIVFGEQVEAAVGWGWVDAVFADLEAEGYACGTAVLPACGVGAPHIRQRLWFVADATGRDQRGHGGEPRSAADASGREARSAHGHSAGGAGAMGVLANANGRDASPERLQRGGEYGQQPEDGRTMRVADSMPAGRPEGRTSAGDRSAAGSGIAGKLAIAKGEQFNRSRGQRPGRRQSSNGRDLEHANGPRSPAGREAATGNRHGGAALATGWADLEWLPCTDGKARPVEPGTFPLAHGIPGRVGRLRAYGNAIVPQVAAEFIRAATE